MKKKLTIGLSALILVACNQPNQEHLNTINHIQVKLDSASYYINSIDFEKMTELGAKSKKDLSYISKNLGLEISKDDAMSLANYRGGMKALTKMQSVYHKTRSDITFSENQLKELRSDINKSALSTEKVEEYLTVEASEVNTNLMMAKKVADAYTRGVTICNLEQAKVDSIIELLYINGYR